MNKLKLGVLLVVCLLAISGLAMAQGPKGNDNVRVIAPTTSFVDKVVFRMKGCTIVHELNDVTALKCPKGIQIKDAIEDKRYHTTDMDANAQINADNVWAMNPSITGEGVTIAVLDTGIDTNHPELSLSIEGGMSFVAYTTSYEDDDGHGTHVAGIITADGVGGTPNGYAKGVAPDAKIWAGKVLDSNGGGWGSDIAAAIEHVVKGPDGVLGTEDDHIADIISMSLGGGNFNGENCDYTGDVLVNAVNWADEQGITVIAASGNDGFFVSIPACASGAIAVGATDKTGLMASYSNFGPSLDIVAPGVSIYSSVIDGYASWGGTSMATPHVSGTVALMLEANPELTVGEIKTALYETADPINPDSVCYGVIKRGRSYFRTIVPCSSDNYGAGIVDAYGAVNAVIATTPICGDNTVNQATEQCDGTDLAEQTCTSQGFDYGTLSCTVDCMYDTSTCGTAYCGNNNAEPSETCDGSDLAGKTCETQGFDAGDLGCNPDCQSFDTTECTITEPACGDGYCAGQDLDEDCETCPADCPSKTHPRKGLLRCCGNYQCEPGEDTDNCPIDCTQ